MRSNFGASELMLNSQPPEHDRADNGCNQQQAKQRPEDLQTLAQGGKQMQPHGIGTIERLTLQREIEDHKIHHLLRHCRAQHQQANRCDHHDGERIELARARNLPFVTRLLESLARGFLCAFLTAVGLCHQLALTKPRSQISASDASS